MKDEKVMWLYGLSDLEKTNLLKGFQHSAVEPCKICFFSAEELAKEMIKSFCNKNSRWPEIETVDVLFIDDADYLIHKTSTQAEIAKLILKKISSGQRVLLASTCHPEKLEVLYKSISEIVLIAETLERTGEKI